MAADKTIQAFEAYGVKMIAEAAKYVTLNPEHFRYLPIQTPEVCMSAVMQDGMQLEHVEKQTPDVCLAAVRQNWKALRFVHDQTYGLCSLAVDRDIRAISLVRDSVIKSDMKELYPRASDYPPVEKREIDAFGKKLIADAVKRIIKKPMLFNYLPLQTPEMCMAAVMRDGMLLEHVEKQTPELCLAAVRQNWRAFEFIEHQNYEISELSTQCDPRAVVKIACTDNRIEFVNRLFVEGDTPIPREPDVRSAILEDIEDYKFRSDPARLASIKELSFLKTAAAPGGPHA